MTFDKETNTYTTSKGTRLTREEAEEIYNALDFEFYCNDVRNEADNLEIELTEDQIKKIVRENILNGNCYDSYFENLDDAISAYRKDDDAEDEEDEESEED